MEHYFDLSVFFFLIHGSLKGSGVSAWSIFFYIGISIIIDAKFMTTWADFVLIVIPSWCFS